MYMEKLDARVAEAQRMCQVETYQDRQDLYFSEIVRTHDEF